MRIGTYNVLRGNEERFYRKSGPPKIIDAIEEEVDLY